MNSYAIVAFFAVLAVSNASVIHGSTAEVLQGPSSRTTLVGPEGSVISSVSPGGQVITDSHSGVVAHTAPVAYAAPAIAAYSAPAIAAYSAPAITAYSAPAVTAYSSPAITTYSGYAAPAVAAYAAPSVLAHSAYSAYAAPSVVSHAAYSAPLAYTSYAAAAPVVAAHGSVDTVVAGPSGTIATSRGLTTADVVGSHGVYARGW